MPCQRVLAPVIGAGPPQAVPLEYSIEWLTCAIASRLAVNIWLACRVLLKIVYLRQDPAHRRPGVAHERDL
jgi:hypothetical protein